MFSTHWFAEINCFYFINLFQKKMVARPQKTTSDNTRYYEMLGVSKTASQYELRSGFIKQVMKDRPIPGKDNPRVTFL